MPCALKGNGLSQLEEKILELVKEHWPISALELAEHLRENLSTREEKKRASTKYAYYLRKLIEKELLMHKRVGNSLIVWPIFAEKYRVVHSILREE
jgi:predicted transcriptional regulator